MLRKIRISLAAVMLIGITWLFVDFTGLAHTWLGWMAKIQFLPAALALNLLVVVALLVITLVLGRAYCSIICPLGVMQDIFGWLGKRRKKNRYNYSPAKTWLRWGVLVVFVVLMLLGLGGIASIIAPYSAYGRIAQSLLQPLWEWGNNLCAFFAERADSYTFYSADVWLRSLPVLIIAVVSLVVLAILAWRGGRTYCNTICPVGTVLGFVSRFALLKIHVDTDKCNKCGLCA
ncbi:MAG: 4Fe-4S binding protein, partial [Bacteroidaceae bacterium]|nr:4Fe-4S binding protein [Bacteroidaceae bacterium]